MFIVGTRVHESKDAFAENGTYTPKEAVVEAYNMQYVRRMSHAEVLIEGDPVPADAIIVAYEARDVIHERTLLSAMVVEDSEALQVLWDDGSALAREKALVAQ